MLNSKISGLKSRCIPYRRFVLASLAEGVIKDSLSLSEGALYLSIPLYDTSLTG